MQREQFVGRVRHDLRRYETWGMAPKPARYRRVEYSTCGNAVNPFRPQIFSKDSWTGRHARINDWFFVTGVGYAN